MKDRLTVAIAAGAEGSGVTFVSGALAAFLREKHGVTLAELGSAYFYTALGMDERFVLRRFTSYRELLKEGKSVRDLRNIDMKINWALQKESFPPMGPAELFRFVSNAPGEVVIFDCSGLSEELLRGVLAESDAQVLVADPLPSRLIKAFPLTEFTRLKIKGAVTLVNKMNKGVSKSELRSALGCKNHISLPAVPPEYIYKAEYKRALPFDFPEVRALLSDGLEELAGALGL